PRGRRDELVRHDGHPEGVAERLRRGRLHELRLRPGAGRPAHGVRAVRVAGEGRQGAAHQDGRRRRRPGRQPDPVPDRRGRRPPQGLRRPAGRRRRRHHGRLPQGHGRLMAAATGDDRSVRSGRKIPYLLLVPGMAFTFVFFVVPLITLLKISLSTKPDRLLPNYDFTWEWGNFSTAFTDFGTQLVR